LNLEKSAICIVIKPGKNYMPLSLVLIGFAIVIIWIVLREIPIFSLAAAPFILVGLILIGLGIITTWQGT
jgi:hypothetical protein